MSDMWKKAISNPEVPFVFGGDEKAFFQRLFHDQGPLAEARRRVNDYYRRDEVDVVKHLLESFDMTEESRVRVEAQARHWVEHIRESSSLNSHVDEFLNEFSLSTDEGVALMCLAEALLRVPDSYTMDRLICDKLSGGNWSSHLGQRESFFVNASTWGLLLTGKFTAYTAPEDLSCEAVGDQVQSFWHHTLTTTLRRLGAPVIRAALRTAMQVMGTHFVVGKNMADALERGKQLEAKGYRFSYDMLGEGARNQADAERYWQRYRDAIELLGKEETKNSSYDGANPVASSGISVKLSALHPRYQLAQRSRVMEELVPKLKQLVLLAKHHNIGLTVDAEEANRLDLSLDIFEQVFKDPDLDGWQGLGLAIQAYQKRALVLIDWALALAQQVERKIVIRLVKGAYWDSEIKWSQESGYSDYPVFTRKAATDVSYQVCAQKLLSYRSHLYPQFATHNAYTVATILEMDRVCSNSNTSSASKDGYRKGYEFQRLHGMGESLYQQVMKEESVACRVYAPVGEHADLLAYLVRRLLENGANSSFVNRLLNAHISVEALLEDPLDVLAATPELRHPDIPLPEDLYRFKELSHGRQNSRGVDLSNATELLELESNLHQWWQQESGAMQSDSKVTLDDSVTIETKLSRAQEAFNEWSQKPVKARAELFRRLAEAFEENRSHLIGLCIKEAGKTIADGVAEVREAIDFCRYYADEAETLMAHNGVQPLGVMLCISPWNFPLAIFLGQLSGALLVGNTVLAKPAEQTRRMALKVTSMMSECGFPQDVLQIIIAPGMLVGEQLLPDERIQGVLFTGSTATGQWLAHALANRPDTDIPLIAETGGQNAMIVDSTALPEQVVDDVLTSGFYSAGQRCSSLRVLFLQEDIADPLITMLSGAMKELTIGDPALLSTDIGPVIDGKALDRLHRHCAYLDSFAPDRQLLDSARLQAGMKTDMHTQSWAKPLYCCDLPEGLEGTFFAPRLYEISDLSVLVEEVFGPVVHVIRYAAEDLDEVIEEINRLGYGLTLGIHSRVESVAEYVASKAKVGNVYVNRNMIGAVVGVQPFGGRGLSGTGPKAGGSHYLKRLVKFSNNPRDEAHEFHLREFEELATVCMENTSIAPRLSVFRECIRHWQGQTEEWIQSLMTDALPELRQLNELISCGFLNCEILNGPVGELNQVILEPKGRVAVVMGEEASFKDAVVSTMSALMAGCDVTVVADSVHQARFEALLSFWLEGVANETTENVSFPSLQLEPLSDLQSICMNSGIEAVVIIGSRALRKSVQQWLVQRGAGMIALIGCDPLEQRLLRFTDEKTITINVSAVGGDASLMSLS
ncbi:bifunctional proline dehydrogenase/L-glutamate gamma-semialdehyde dehydrogenase PutA [Pseudomaricurvus albidus]|uniref:bifunctional proline dehydrogenase/L-glutamate gamma-semialdehyde dehydrogenase PutA n=1 Tax=Pseudomaricurvus albidus TaxID=2842452 RepID=UPI001F32BB32|nr:bifunctional proline dehydrogenase/L-glutamate gamma-semialdehyde dehydrogenase PutA [Aestuariicella albida]